MSEVSVPGNFKVAIDAAASSEMASRATESDLDYYGWRVVLAACLGVMAGFGSLFVYTFSVFVKPLAAEFGWTREAISSGFAIAAVTLGLISPLLGRWIDRFGPRRVILPCMTVYVCGFVSLALLRAGVWQYTHWEPCARAGGDIGYTHYVRVCADRGPKTGRLD
jgi:cyanate permease